MILDSILNIGSKIIDKIFPDKEKADAAKLELFKLEQDGKLRELEQEVQQERIAADDRASARSREMVLAQSGNRDYVPSILAIGLLVGFFGLMVLLIFVDIDQDVVKIIDIMLGSLGTGFITVLNYYFGTSKSSRRKDDAIEQFISNQQKTPS